LLTGGTFSQCQTKLDLAWFVTRKEPSTDPIFFLMWIKKYFFWHVDVALLVSCQCHVRLENLLLFLLIFINFCLILLYLHYGVPKIYSLAAFSRVQIFPNDYILWLYCNGYITSQEILFFKIYMNLNNFFKVRVIALTSKAKSSKTVHRNAKSYYLVEANGCFLMNIFLNIFWKPYE